MVTEPYRSAHSAAPSKREFKLFEVLGDASFRSSSAKVRSTTQQSAFIGRRFLL
jgi:hypothetical protein